MENAGKQIEDEDLAAVLHEKGIGTPATRADIIENLIAKGYVVRLDKGLRPAVKGIRLIDTLKRIHIDRLTSPQLTGEIESHLIEVERGGRTAKQFMTEIAEYATEIVDRAKSFEYDELYDANQTLGPCPTCGRPVIEMAWFYRCKPEPDVAPEQDCPMRFWKDTSGRYLDRHTVQTLLRDGKTPVMDGFTARSGRTYRAHIEIDREAWQLKVRSAGWDEGGTVVDVPEYEVNPEPLGPCPAGEACYVVESPTQFVCERALKEEDAAKDEDAAQELWLRAAAHGLQARDHARGSARLRRGRQDRAADGFHVALRPALLGDARAQADGATRIRVPAARARRRASPTTTRRPSPPRPGAAATQRSREARAAASRRAQAEPAHREGGAQAGGCEQARARRDARPAHARRSPARSADAAASKPRAPSRGAASRSRLDAATSPKWGALRSSGSARAPGRPPVSRKTVAFAFCSGI